MISVKTEPLVTILIPNYNYGQYLEHCFESILNQTYRNIEVRFSDNSSTDASFDIAYKYKKIFKENGIYMRISDNKRNIGSDRNSQVAVRDAEGEYVYTLASDDAIKPDFLTKTIGLLEEYRNVGYVMVNREEIDENGNITKLPPFYNTSCIIKGEDQAAVHMMAGIAIPAQRIVRYSVANATFSSRRNWSVAGDWFDNFLYSCVSDAAYIKEDLVQYRVHSGNETSESELNLLGVSEHYQLINAFVDIAKAYRIQKPIDRYDEAVAHLGDMCLRYALKMYKCNRPDVAKRYLYLAPVYKESILQDERYQWLMGCQAVESADDLQMKIEEYEKQYSSMRTNSYDPPIGFIPI